MKMPRSIEEILANQMRRSEQARERRIEEGRKCVNPVITISRTMGSGGRIVARKLAEDLGFSLWDRELLDAVAEESQVSPRVIEAFDEKRVSELERIVYAALGDYEMSDFMYPKHLARAVASIASIGNAVILGRGANYLLPNALNIRMDASMERRVANMMNYEDIGRDEAERKLRQSDRERERFVTSTFDRAKTRAFRFDLTFWMDKFTPIQAASVIKTAYATLFLQTAGGEVRD